MVFHTMVFWVGVAHCQASSESSTRHNNIFPGSVSAKASDALTTAIVRSSEELSVINCVCYQFLGVIAYLWAFSSDL